MRNGMARDFSWGASAREYGKIYDRARQARAAADAVAVTTDLKKEPVSGLALRPASTQIVDITTGFP